MKRRPQGTISYPRALLMATIPALPTWRQIRETTYPEDQPLSRRPRVLEVILVLLGGGVVASGIVADSSIIQMLGGFAAASWAIRPLARLVIPRRVARTERELIALTIGYTPIGLFWLVLPVYLAVRGEWLTAAMITCILVVGIVLGVFLLRLMFSGIVGRKGNHAIS